jgi:hypothetical protein
VTLDELERAAKGAALCCPEHGVIVPQKTMTDLIKIARAARELLDEGRNWYHGKAKALYDALDALDNKAPVPAHGGTEADHPARSTPGTEALAPATPSLSTDEETKR